MLNFDLIVMLKLPFTPGCAEWIFKVHRARARGSLSAGLGGSGLAACPAPALLHLFKALLEQQQQQQQWQ